MKKALSTGRPAIRGGINALSDRAHLRAQRSCRQTTANRLGNLISGDEGGIVSHIVPEDGRNAIIVSLTHSSLPFATAVFDYQKHRVKKPKKQRESI